MATFMRLALLAAVLAVASAQAVTPVEDTTGKSVSVATDFTFGTNVGTYLKFSEDVCAVKPLLKAGDYAAASDIYTNGRSVFTTSGGKRTLKGVATSVYDDEETWNLYNNYFVGVRGQELFLDTFITDALAGTAPFTTAPRRSESAEKGMQNVLQTVYLFHELDEAEAKIANGTAASLASAAGNVDETFAIYVGKDIDCSPWGTAEKRAIEFGTRASCTRSAVNAAIVPQFLKARTAAAAGDAADFAAAKREIQRLIVLTHLQNVNKYAQLVDEDPANADENQAEGYAFFRTIEPLAHQASAPATATIVKLMYPGNPIVPNTSTQVRAAVNTIATNWRITATELGTLGAKQALNCPATSSTTPTASSVTGGSPTSSTPAAATQTSSAAALGSSVAAAVVVAAAAIML